MSSIRPWVVVLAAASLAAPALFLGFMGFSVILRGSGSAPPAVLYAVLGGWVASAIARGIVGHRLSSAEQAFVRFWSFAALFTLFVGLALGVLPLLLLHGFGVQLAPGAVRAIVALVLVLSALVVRALLLRFRASLSGAQKGAA